MYAYVKGTLIQSSPMEVVMEAAGIGYKILIPASAFAKLPATGNELQLYTSFVVREVSQTLYGFVTKEERDLFEQLTGAVSGVGPKLALSLIGHLSMGDFQKALVNHDSAMISKVPGIGKKTAERLILELRDKLSFSAPSPSDYAIPVHVGGQQKILDAMNALIHLGYQQAAAKKAVQKTLSEKSDALELAELITESLKNI